MRQLNAIVQTSLDGFVAGVKGEFDNFIGGEENLGFVCGIIDEADAIMLGRNSFELLNAYWPTAANRPEATKNEIKYSNWYNSASKTVVSGTMKPNNGVHILNEINPSTLNEIKSRNGKNILIFGSPTVVHQLLDSNLIDNIWLIVHPVIFGNGIPLFRTRNQVIKAKLLQSSQLSNGTLCSKYSMNDH
ncbi:MAG TPA: dihydrofolate reductase family protein [Chitinophagaceae bacterium]